MNDSDQDEHSPTKVIEQINIYTLISEAKPVISPTRMLEKEISFKAVLSDAIPHKKFKNGLFKREGYIEDYPFSCNFQCGNLESVSHPSPGNYVIKLRSDTNSQHKSSWFYFKVKGIKAGTFFIRGLPKPNLLYNQGMKLCVKENDKWLRGGNYISYDADESGEYCLQFQHTFSQPDIPTDIASCFPYSYSELQSNLKLLVKKYSKLITRQSIAKTILGSEVECLVFGTGLNKPIIIISARVHPSQTVSSYIVQGLMEWLVSAEQAQQLLEVFEIRVIPMLNPDGVRKGNHRFSFAGTDLNRKWKTPGQRLHPEIYYVRNYIQQIDQKRIRMLVDLHGHSRKKGVFFYGCEVEKSFDSKVREFPYLMSKISSYYQYSKSCFKVQASKQGTARIYLWRMLKIPYIYTLQCSLCSVENSKKNFQIHDLLKIGNDLGRGFRIFFSDVIKLPMDNTNSIKICIEKQFQSDRNVLLTEEGSEGSESQPSEGEMEEERILEVLQLIKDGKSHHPQRLTINTNISHFTNLTGFSIVDEKSLATIKNFRKKISCSYNSEKRKKTMSLVSKIDASQTFKCYEQDKYFKQKQAQYIGEVDVRVKYLDQILLSNQPNFPHTSYKNNQANNIFRLQNTESVSLPIEMPLKVDTNSDEIGLKANFFGAQYVRVKKYAQKILKDKEKKKQQPVQNSIQPSYPATSERLTKQQIMKRSGELKLEIIPLRKKQEGQEIDVQLKRFKSSSHRSTTVNK